MLFSILIQVALIKMAPRPITMVVAKEISEVPPAVLEEQRRAQTPTQPSSTTTSPAYFRPSPANGDEGVGQVSESNQVECTTNSQIIVSSSCTLLLLY